MPVSMENTFKLTEGPDLMDGHVVLCISVGQECPTFVKCKKRQAQTIADKLTRVYNLLAAQGAHVTPHQIKAVAIEGERFTDTSILAYTARPLLS